MKSYPNIFQRIFSCRQTSKIINTNIPRKNGKYKINKVRINLKQSPFNIYEVISNKKV